MVRRLVLALAGTAALLAPAAPARAQFPGLSLSFVQPSGTVGPTETVDVWLRLSLAPGAAPLVFDGNDAAGGFGLPDALLPDVGRRADNTTAAFDRYTRAITNTSFVCADTFTGNCGSAPYAFSFHVSNANPARPAFGFRTGFTLLPGQSFDYLFGRFVPTVPSVPPGTYEFYGAAALVSVFGTDAAGNELTASLDLARSCRTGDASCAFTRTVTAVSAVPEPGSVALLATGLVALAAGGAARRRRRPGGGDPVAVIPWQ